MPRNSTTCHGDRRRAWSGRVRSEPTSPGADPSSVEIAESSVIGARSMSITAPPARTGGPRAARRAHRRQPAAPPWSSTTASGWSRRASRPRSETRSRPSSAACAARVEQRPVAEVRGERRRGPRPGRAASRPAPRPPRGRPRRRPRSLPCVSAQVTDCSSRSTPLSGCARLGRNRSARSTSSSSAASSTATWRAFSRLARTAASTARTAAASIGSTGTIVNRRASADSGSMQLLVLLGRRRADDRDVAPGERRLEALGDVVDGGQREDVHLVEEHDDRRVTRLLEQVLDHARVRRGRRGEPQQRHVVDPGVAQRLGHLALRDPDREPLDDRRLARPGGADQRRVALRPPEQHADERPDLALAPDDGAQPPVPGQPDEVAAEPVEGRGRGRPLRPGDGDRLGVRARRRSSGPRRWRRRSPRTAGRAPCPGTGGSGSAPRRTGAGRRARRRSRSRRSSSRGGRGARRRPGGSPRDPAPRRRSA